MTGVIGLLVSTPFVFPGAVTPVLLPSESQHVSAEANTLHSSGQAAAVSPGLAGMRHQTEHSALHGASG